MSKHPSSFRSPMSTVRGLGSAKDGVHHWWMQRVTAIILIPLTVWFMCSLMSHVVGKDLQALKDWLGSPGVAITLLVMLTALFYHARLGLQVVIEDYVHCACKKTALIVFITILFPVLTLISWMSVLKIHFWTI